MSYTETFSNWENLVKKQLKTEDIYAILKKDNLEGIDIKPFYNDVKIHWLIFPKWKKVLIWWQIIMNL